MRVTVVIFDLFGTLVANVSTRALTGVLARMAAVLAVPPHDFERLWFGETQGLRATGVFETVEANVAHICQALGKTASPTQLAMTAAIRVDQVRQALSPRSDAIETLTQS